MGGNRLCVASTGPGEMRSRTEAMRWAVRIRTGLDDDQFELYCQDIVASTALVQGGRHFEVLLRLNPGGKLLMPGDRSEEHKYELQSLMSISYDVLCCKTQYI